MPGVSFGRPPPLCVPHCRAADNSHQAKEPPAGAWARNPFPAHANTHRPMETPRPEQTGARPAEKRGSAVGRKEYPSPTKNKGNLHRPSSPPWRPQRDMGHRASTRKRPDLPGTPQAQLARACSKRHELLHGTWRGKITFVTAPWCYCVLLLFIFIADTGIILSLFIRGSAVLA